MTTRDVTDTILHADGTPWAGALVYFDFLEGSYTAVDDYPPDRISAVTDAAGRYEVLLWCDEEGISPASYLARYPGGQRFRFDLPVGDGLLVAMSTLRTYEGDPAIAANLATLLASLAFTDLADTPASYVGQAGKAVVVAPTADGLVFAAGGGAVTSINGETGIVTLDASDVGADATGTAAGLVATEAATRAADDTTLAGLITTEAATRAADDTTLAGLITTEAGTRAAADTALQTNITTEATTRTTADSTHAALTTTAHGGIVASSDARLSDARTPTAHAASHASAGSDPLTLAQSQITNLTTDLAARQPLDSDLTAIAALTTTSYGRALLALADAAAGRTALSVDASGTAASLLATHEADTTAVHGIADTTKLAVLGTQALTDGASIAWDAALGAFATVTLGGNRTLANPTNLKAGAAYALMVTQDGTGTRTLAYGSAFKWAGGTAPTLSTTIGTVDILTFISIGGNLYGVLQKAWA